MGCFISTCEEISKLWFELFPHSCRNIDRLVRTSAGVFGINSKVPHRIYTTNKSIAGNFAYANAYDENTFEGIFKALVKLGVASQSVVDEHLELAARKGRSIDAERAIKCLSDWLGKYDLELTKGQRKKLEAIARG